MCEKGFNVITTPWGTIAEDKLNRNADASQAMIVLDPGKEKGPEFHKKTTEVFEVIFGVGYIKFPELTTSLNVGNMIRVNPWTKYSIGTNDIEPFCLLATLTPPFDPDDQFETEF
jgi:mannose-6-phosphate isomerase-like protein (cupin superfamily)